MIAHESKHIQQENYVNVAHKRREQIQQDDYASAAQKRREPAHAFIGMHLPAHAVNARFSFSEPDML